MFDLYTAILAHRANHHILFTYLDEHHDDQTAWDIFASHHYTVLKAFPHYMEILYDRLTTKEAEVLHDLVEPHTHPPVLIPLERFNCEGAVTAEVLDIPTLDEIEAFIDWHQLSMKAKTIPTAFGILYSQLVDSPWRERMELLLEPYQERTDLITSGAMDALLVRNRMWDGIYEAITGKPAPTLQ